VAVAEEGVRFSLPAGVRQPPERFSSTR